MSQRVAPRQCSCTNLFGLTDRIDAVVGVEIASVGLRDLVDSRGEVILYHEIQDGAQLLLQNLARMTREHGWHSDPQDQAEYL